VDRGPIPCGEISPNLLNFIITSKGCVESAKWGGFLEPCLEEITFSMGTQFNSKLISSHSRSYFGGGGGG